MTCYENNFSFDTKKQFKEEITKKFELKEKKVASNILKFCLNEKSYAEKKQVLSLLYNSGYSYAELCKLIIEIKKINKELELSSFVSQQTFSTYMAYYKENPDLIGKPVTQTRNKFLLPKDKFVKILYNFCLLSSETIPNKYILIDSKQEERRSFKEFLNRTALLNEFVSCFENGFGENEQQIFNCLNEDEWNCLKDYRIGRNRVKQLLAQKNLGEFEGFFLFIYLFLFIFF
jgi:hypothetical protein